VPGAYLDNCIVSGLANEDLGTELEALYELLEHRKHGRLDVVTSHVTHEELERASADSRHGLRQVVYFLLADVPAVPEARHNSRMLLMGVGGGTREDARFTQLKEVLPDVDGARHVFQVIANGLDYFVTVDARTVLRHRRELERLGIRALKPSELVAELRSAATADAG
jgi:hypothetical protein